MFKVIIIGGKEMKQIKFRIWDRKEKKMIYSNEFRGFMDLEGTICTIDKKGNLCYDYLDKGKSPRDRYVPLQFIGYKDKNKKEIYEGDIVAGPKDEYYSVYKIGLYDIGFGYEIIMSIAPGHTPNDKGPFPIGIGRDFCSDDLEIIGNVYENPKLLKV